MSTIRDLSPGNKLSLKGKLFELQKKLTLLDLERKISEEYSYQPHFYNNNRNSGPMKEKELDDSSSNSISNSNSNSKAHLYVDPRDCIGPEEEEYNFQPIIYTKNKHKSKMNTLPVHERLYENAKTYKEHLNKLSEEIYSKDENGQPLFKPQINNPSNFSSITSDSENRPHQHTDSDNIKVQEYLYRDALNREARLRQKREDMEQAAIEASSSVRVNKKSAELLKAKADRRIRSLFDMLIVEPTDVTITRAEIQVAVEAVIAVVKGNSISRNNNSNTNSTPTKDSSATRAVEIDNMYSMMDMLWNALDSDQTGVVNFNQFSTLCSPIVLKIPQSQGGAGSSTVPAPTSANRNLNMSSSGLGAGSGIGCSAEDGVALLCKYEADILKSKIEAEKARQAAKMAKGRRGSILSTATSGNSRNASPTKISRNEQADSPSKGRRSMSPLDQQKIVTALSNAATLSSQSKQKPPSPNRKNHRSKSPNKISVDEKRNANSTKNTSKAEFENRLTTASQKSKLRKEKIMKEMMADCTFKPKIHTITINKDANVNSTPKKESNFPNALKKKSIELQSPKHENGHDGKPDFSLSKRRMSSPGKGVQILSVVELMQHQNKVPFQSPRNSVSPHGRIGDSFSDSGGPYKEGPPSPFANSKSNTSPSALVKSSSSSPASPPKSKFSMAALFGRIDEENEDDFEGEDREGEALVEEAVVLDSDDEEEEDYNEQPPTSPSTSDEVPETNDQFSEQLSQNEEKDQWENEMEPSADSNPITVESESSKGTNISTHERLYKTRRQSMIVAELPKPLTRKEQEDLMECTFRPTLGHTFARVSEEAATSPAASQSVSPDRVVYDKQQLSLYNKRHEYYQQMKSKPKVANSKGFEEYINRIKKGKAMRQEAQEAYEKLGKLDEEKYRRNRELLYAEAGGAKDYKSHLDANGHSKHGCSYYQRMKVAAVKHQKSDAIEPQTGGEIEPTSSTANIFNNMGPEGDAAEMESDLDNETGNVGFFAKAFKRSSFHEDMKVQLPGALTHMDSNSEHRDSMPPPPPPVVHSGTGTGTTSPRSVQPSNNTDPNFEPDKFVVNIKLSVNKTVPIVVYNDSTSAHELATNFAKIHALDTKAIDVLTNVLQQHIDIRMKNLANHT